MSQVSQIRATIQEGRDSQDADWLSTVERAWHAIIKKCAPSLFIRLAIGVAVVALVLSFIKIELLRYLLEQYSPVEFIKSLQERTADGLGLWLLWVVSLGWTIVVLFFFGLLGWFFLEFEVLKPLKIMTRAANKRKHGDYADFLSARMVPLTEMGNLGRILNDCFDRLAENHAQIRQLAKVVNSTHNAVVLTNKNGRIEWVNAGFNRQFGYSMLETLGMKPELLLAGDKTSQEITKKISKSLSLGHGFDAEILHYDKDDQPHLMALEVRPLRDDKGSLEGGMLIETDISEFKDKLRELREAKEDASLAKRTKAEFLTTVDHEIRTPMNSILGIADMLMDTELDRAQKDLVLTSKKSGKLLMMMFEHIIEYTKLREGHIQLAHASVELASLLEDCVEASYEYVIEQEKPLDIAYSIGGPAPRVVVTDRNYLAQLICELLRISAFFLEKGELSLKVTASGLENGKQRLCFRVWWESAQVSPEGLVHIRRLFSKGGEDRALHGGELALGLEVARELGHLFEGKLYHHFSQQGISSISFELDVPVGSVGDWCFQVDRRFENKKVLAIEKSQTQLEFMDHFTQEWGMRLKSVTDIEKFEQLVNESESFDFVIIDGACSENDVKHLLNILKSKNIFSRPYILGSFCCNLVEQENAQVVFGQKPLTMRQFWNGLVEASLTEVSGSKRAREDLSLDKMKVLLVEDNRVNQCVMISMLGKLGLAPDVVDNGEMALSALEEKDYDVILMDIEMPEMDGFTATKRIREMHLKSAQSAIIAMTAYSMDSDRQRCLDAGMDDFLSKPFGVRELKTALFKAKGLLHRLELAN
ncbi:MAG: response regulator [Verrucomicrobiota bacterium]